MAPHVPLRRGCVSSRAPSSARSQPVHNSRCLRAPLFPFTLSLYIFIEFPLVLSACRVKFGTKRRIQTARRRRGQQAAFDELPGLRSERDECLEKFSGIPWRCGWLRWRRSVASRRITFYWSAESNRLRASFCHETFFLLRFLFSRAGRATSLHGHAETI